LTILTVNLEPNVQISIIAFSPSLNHQN